MDKVELRVSPKSPLSRQSIAEWRIDVRGFESLEHEVKSTDAQHRFAGVRAPLAVLAVATTTAKPGERAVDHPTFRQRDESLASRRTPDDFHAPVARRRGGNPRVELMLMVLVSSPSHGQARLVLRAPWLQPLRRGGASSRAARLTPTAHSHPSRSTRTWRVRPWILLPPSSPRSPPRSVVCTD
jgi:hypothetical protein